VICLWIQIILEIFQQAGKSWAIDIYPVLIKLLVALGVQYDIVHATNILSTKLNDPVDS